MCYFNRGTATCMLFIGNEPGTVLGNNSEHRWRSIGTATARPQWCEYRRGGRCDCSNTCDIDQYGLTPHWMSRWSSQ
jgi:hypothetical protein